MDAVRSYVAIWSEPDPERREALLRQCWTEESEIIGPGYCFKGFKAVLDEAARFLRDEPGFTVSQTSEFDQHGVWVRFTIAVVDASGETLNEGWDIIELDSEGKIARVITFWGHLPTRQAASESKE